MSRKAAKLLEMFPDKFSADIEKNKQGLNEFGVFKSSKKIRNMMAGYITRIINQGPSVK